MFNLPHSGIKLNLRKEPALSGPVFCADMPKTAFLPLKSGGKDFYPEGLKIGSEVQRGQILAYAREDRELRIISPFDGIYEGIAEKKHPYYRRISCLQISTSGGGGEETTEDEAAAEGVIADAAAISGTDAVRGTAQDSGATEDVTAQGEETSAAGSVMSEDDKTALEEEDILDIPLPDMTLSQLAERAKAAGIIDETDGVFLYEKLLEADESCCAAAVSSLDSRPFASSGTAALLKYKKEVCGGLRLISQAMGGVSKHILIYGEECAGKIAGDSIGDIKLVKLVGNYPFMPMLPDGAFIIGVQAAKALYDACADAKLNFKQIITVSGSAVGNPQNIEAYIGTPIIELIEHCSLDLRPGRILADNVMMGQSISASSVVFPGLSAITVLTDKETRHATACIGCGRCVNVCPKKIMPCYILRDYQNENINGEDFRRAQSCIGCGLCSYVCPSGINVAKIVARSANVLRRAALYEHAARQGGQQEESV